MCSIVQDACDDLDMTCVKLDLSYQPCAWNRNLDRNCICIMVCQQARRITTVLKLLFVMVGDIDAIVAVKDLESRYRDAWEQGSLFADTPVD